MTPGSEGLAVPPLVRSWHFVISPCTSGLMVLQPEIINHPEVQFWNEII